MVAATGLAMSDVTVTTRTQQAEHPAFTRTQPSFELERQTPKSKKQKGFLMQYQMHQIDLHLRAGLSQLTQRDISIYRRHSKIKILPAQSTSRCIRSTSERHIDLPPPLEAQSPASAKHLWFYTQIL